MSGCESGSSSTSCSPSHEIPSIRSTSMHRQKVSHSFSVPLNLFSATTRNDQPAAMDQEIDQSNSNAAK